MALILATIVLLIGTAVLVCSIFQVIPFSDIFFIAGSVCLGLALILFCGIGCVQCLKCPARRAKVKESKIKSTAILKKEELKQKKQVDFFGECEQLSSTIKEKQLEKAEDILKETKGSEVLSEEKKSEEKKSKEKLSQLKKDLQKLKAVDSPLDDSQRKQASKIRHEAMGIWTETRLKEAEEVLEELYNLLDK